MLGPPSDETELLRRATALAGLTLGNLARQLGERIPSDLRRHKGWTGQLIEKALGADAGSLPQPDFRALHVELKTLPVDGEGRPRESTYVCTVPLDGGYESWERSWVRNKLRRVLWLPVEAGQDHPVAHRRIGMPLLWSPAPDEEEALRRDWEELMEMIATGRLAEISARRGEVLQIRPKAANSRALCPAVGPEGETVMTNPRGFYLRPAFTAAILRRHYAI